jgi:hypothetical protein
MLMPTDVTQPRHPTDRDDSRPASAPRVTRPPGLKFQRQRVVESLMRCPETASERQRS